VKDKEIVFFLKVQVRLSLLTVHHQLLIPNVVNGHIILKMELFDLHSMDDVYLLIDAVQEEKLMLYSMTVVLVIQKHCVKEKINNGQLTYLLRRLFHE
jgi:hypothetical protein